MRIARQRGTPACVRFLTAEHLGHEREIRRRRLSRLSRIRGMHRIPSLREMRNHFPAVQFCPNGSFYASRSLGFVKDGADGFEFTAAA
jgi:hypothetical protein